MSNNSADTLSDIRQVLGLDRLSVGRKSVRFVVAALVVLGLIAAVVTFLRSGEGTAIQFKTAETKRGDLTVIVTATGTLEPVNQVDVDTERSLLSFQDQLAQSKGQVTSNLISLYKALGGGWTPLAAVPP